LTPAFHFSILNSFVEVFNEQSRILCGIIGDICQSFADGKGEMDVYPLITRCSLDIICGKHIIIFYVFYIINQIFSVNISRGCNGDENQCSNGNF
jgi:hypothetical protein